MKKIELCEIDIDMDEELYEWLVEFGLSKIIHDKKELANYAMNVILKDKIEDLKKENKL